MNNDKAQALTAQINRRLCFQDGGQANDGSGSFDFGQSEITFYVALQSPESR